MGGEKQAEKGGRPVAGGSPPRGRGKDCRLCQLDPVGGITPAWAGKRTAETAGEAASQDHPRVGGEKLTAYGFCQLVPGSPPRGRGKVDAGMPILAPVRITPAWAGKRLLLFLLSEQNRDHPRVGGEKRWYIECILAARGSPPRGRGKVSRTRFKRDQNRITPAWAGKRLKRSHRSGIFISGPIPFHSVLHRPAGSGGSRAGRDGSPAGQPQNAGPA